LAFWWKLLSTCSVVELHLTAHAFLAVGKAAITDVEPSLDIARVPKEGISLRPCRIF